MPQSQVRDTGRQGLSQFIRQNLERITEEWTNFAYELADEEVPDFILRDHIHPILFNIADNIEQKQPGGKSDKQEASAASIHAELRYDIGFDMGAMMEEYRALRTTVIKLWTKTRVVLTDADILDLIRFNEAIDRLLIQSVSTFMEKCQINAQ